MAGIQSNNKRGSIGITIVMMVFCFLMAVSMSYQKTVQTENMIRHNVSYTDRATDAAFAGVNYAMAFIQSKRGSKVKILLSGGNDESNWIYLKNDSNATTADRNKYDYNKYYDDDRNTVDKKIPPYRFIISCNGTSDSNGNYTSYYTDSGKDYVLVKSYGEYLKYEEDNIVARYSAQLMAECEIDKTSGTVKLRRYRRMQPQIFYNENNTINTTKSAKFDSFSTTDVKNRYNNDY